MVTLLIDRPVWGFKIELITVVKLDRLVISELEILEFRLLKYNWIDEIKWLMIMFTALKIILNHKVIYSSLWLNFHFYTEEFSSFDTQGTNSRNINIYL